MITLVLDSRVIKLTTSVNLPVEREREGERTRREDTVSTINVTFQRVGIIYGSFDIRDFVLLY